MYYNESVNKHQKVRYSVLARLIIEHTCVLVKYFWTPLRTFGVIYKKGGTIMCTLYERIMDLCKQNGVSGSRMCLNLGLSKSTLSDMKSGRKNGISTATAKKIASYFNVSVGYLLGEEEKKEQFNESELSIKKKEFIQKVQEMTDAQIERLEQILALVEKTDL